MVEYHPDIGHLFIPEEKICSYLLSISHPVGRYKAAFFRSMGFSSDNWKKLVAALLVQAKNGLWKQADSNLFGERYIVDGPFKGRNGKTVKLRTVWFLETGEKILRFVTAYPLNGDVS